MPISNLCISTNMKYEWGRGLGRTSWIKQQRRTIGEGLGILGEYGNIGNILLEGLGNIRLFPFFM